MRWQRGIVEFSNLLFFVRPIIALLPLIACGACIPLEGDLVQFGLCAIGVSFLLQVIFALAVVRKMYCYRETLLDFRIIFVLPISYFMIYYETVWFFHGLLTPYADEGLECYEEAIK